MTGKNRIMIYGPKTDGTYVIEFRTAETAVLKHFRGTPPFSCSGGVLVFVSDMPFGTPSSWLWTLVFAAHSECGRGAGSL
jgi:hypothetical protein